MMKIFELRWNKQGEEEWIAAHTNIEAIKTYLSITGTNITDLDDEDEVVEIPKEEWNKMTIRNTDYDSNNLNDSKSQTFEKYMKNCKTPDLIAGTMYE